MRPRIALRLALSVAVLLAVERAALSRVESNRNLAEETAAILIVRSLATAQEQHHLQFATYASNLHALGPLTGADLIPSELMFG